MYLFQHEPGDRHQDPDTGCKGDQDAQTPIVVCLAIVDMQSPHNAHNDGKYHDLTNGLESRG